MRKRGIRTVVLFALIFMLMFSEAFAEEVEGLSETVITAEETAASGENDGGEAEDFDFTYRRFNDYLGVTDKKEDEWLEKKCRRGMALYRCDFVVCLTGDIRDEDQTDFANRFYSANGYGFGEEKSGLLLVFDETAGRYGIYTYGEIDARLRSGEYHQLFKVFKTAYLDPEKSFAEAVGAYLDAAFGYIENGAEDAVPEETAASEAEETSETGDMTEAEVLSETLPDETVPSQTGESSVPETADTSETAGRAADPDSDKPFWYVADPDSFVDFHGEDLPLVQDDAELFSASEEAQLEEVIGRIKAAYPLDLTVYTTPSAYGMEHERLAADYYVYRGYGIGDDYSGTVLMICMDPEDRGWWTAATGICEALFTEDVNERVDDAMADDMIDGNYGEAVLQYLLEFERIYDDRFHLPAWYPSDFDHAADRSGRVYAAVRATELPSVVDEAGLFTPEELAELEALIRKQCLKNGVDILLFTDTSAHGIPVGVYGEDYRYYHGYPEDGLSITMINDRGVIRYAVGAAGEGAPNVEAAMDDILINAKYILEDSRCEEGAEQLIKDAAFASRKGRTPVSWIGAGFMAFMSALISLAATSLLGQKFFDIDEVREKTDAERELVTDSVIVRSYRPRLINTVTKTERRYTETTKGSGSSGSGSSSYKSTHKSSYSSSSGRSFSGGGRKF